MAENQSTDKKPVYNKGDTIYRSQPWVYCVDDQNVSVYCHFCFERPTSDSNLKRCSACHYARYCSDTCQKRDWKNRHKGQCAIMSEALKHLPPNGCLGSLSKMLQILDKLKRGDICDALGACIPPTKRTFMDLLSHHKVCGAETLQYWKSRYDELAPYLKMADTKGNLVKDLVGYCELRGRDQVNGFRIKTYEMGRDLAIGSGIFLGPSEIDHSCRPNSVFRTEGTTLIITAICQIATHADVTIQYIDVFASRSARQKAFQAIHFCECKCKICIDPLVEADRLAFRCMTNGCSVPIPMNDKVLPTCRQCGNTNIGQMAAAKRAVDQLTHVLEEYGPYNMPQTLPRLLKLLSDAEKVLHSTNFILGLAFEKVALLEETLGRPELAIKYFMKAHLIAQLHLGAGNKHCTEIAEYIATKLTATGPNLEALPYVVIAREGFGLAYGENSALYKVWCMMETMCKTNSGQ